MKRILGISATYILYLLVLGQGCSALKGVDHVVSVPVPSLKVFQKIQSPKIKKVKLSSAPEAPKTTPVAESNESVVKQVEEPHAKSIAIAQRKAFRAFKNESSSKSIKAIKKDIAIAANDEVAPAVNEPTKEKKNEVHPDQVKDHELSLDTGIEHFGFQHNTDIKIASWEERFGNSVESKLAELSRLEEERVANLPDEKSNTVVSTEPVAQNEVSKEEPEKVYSPEDPSAIAQFRNDEMDFSDIVKKKESATSKNKSDELVLIDYSKDSAGDLENEPVESTAQAIDQVAKVDISSNVTNVIEREMDSVTDRKSAPKKKPTPLLAMADMANVRSQILNQGAGSRPQGDPSPTQKADSFSKNDDPQNKITLFALEASINGGFNGDVRNFNFIPSFNTNKVFEDFNEGYLNFDYSLKNSSGILRGTIIKNYYMRTTFELPLGSEYSKFEIPMITQESLEEYLDQNDLDGYGGYYLVDLGEYIEDVDIESSGERGRYLYEHRLLLDENFKKTDNAGNFRYVLFIGVQPGNVNVRYLGVNGQESSKITFVAPDEITYDFSQLERPHELFFKTKIRNTLGRSATDLPVDPEKILNFRTGDHPSIVAPAEYKMNIPWSVKGSRTYLEMGYLSDSVFVGLDGDKQVELPSREFIGETLRSFRMDGLNRECLVQINLSGDIKDILVFSESFRGPSPYDHTYLDKDGVFTPEASPLSEKLFLLGNEEGIFNIKIDYADGSQDYLRTYCSPSTYLVEQL